MEDRAMKPSISWLEYQQLELIIPQKPDARFQNARWWSAFVRGWQALFHSIVRPSDLTVWCSQDASGIIWWSAHDAVTGLSIDHVSEDQIRVWIEQRYRY
jgi:hypothetical protein